jgi:hypothetical protein
LPTKRTRKAKAPQTTKQHPLDGMAETYKQVKEEVQRRSGERGALLDFKPSALSEAEIRAAHEELKRLRPRRTYGDGKFIDPMAELPPEIRLAVLRKAYASKFAGDVKPTPEEPKAAAPVAAESEPQTTLSAEPVPGRPTVMHIVRQEMERRAETGAMAGSLHDESEYLANWIPSHCGSVRPPGPSTIRKKLGRLYRELKPGDETAAKL